MKNTLESLSLVAGRVDKRHIQLALTLLGIILFVLGAGAPGDLGSG